MTEALTAFWMAALACTWVWYDLPKFTLPEIWK